MHFCSGWGDIINFVLLSQPSSQWDLTWETILTQAVLGSFEWENFFFECWNCTFYKPGMFMGLRLNRSKNTPFYNCPHHCYSKFKVSPLFVTWAVQKFTTCSLDKCFRCCLTLGLRATFVLDTDFWLHVGVSCICVFVYLGLDWRECWCGSWEQVFVQFSKQGAPPSLFHQISTPPDSQYQRNICLCFKQIYVPYK